MSNKESIKELVKLANSQIPNLLTKLGIDFSHSGRWLTAPCKIHGGDNRQAFCFNSDKAYWKCFTRGCQEKFGNNIIGVVSGVLGYNFSDSIEWLINNIDEDVKIFQKIERKEDKIYPETYLQRLFRNDFYLKRGFKQETLNDFEHGKAEAYALANRIVFPIRDENGMIRGFSGRWAGTEKIIDNETKCFDSRGNKVVKWRHTSFCKSNYLYNYYRAKQYCQEELIIVESIANVMRFWECGKKNCVASFGKDLSIRQVQLIIPSTKKVILAYDNDEAGVDGSRKAFKTLEPYINVEVMSSNNNQDWAEKSNEEVISIYENHKCQPQSA